ncbi:hypothetical protein [Streptomyces sp. NPDC058861]|uniref:hypothetical protein n=1 Tax=Streptomyces sp. NPDC058861 TaxID=3346653 RepID=UPI0036840B68
MTTPVNEGTPPLTVPPSGGTQQGGADNGEGPLLSAHAMLVFVGATLIGLVCGGLTYASTGNTAGAMLAGLTAAGVSAATLHKLIGP